MLFRWWDFAIAVSFIRSHPPWHHSLTYRSCSCQYASYLHLSTTTGPTLTFAAFLQQIAVKTKDFISFGPTPNQSTCHPHGPFTLRYWRLLHLLVEIPYLANQYNDIHPFQQHQWNLFINFYTSRFPLFRDHRPTSNAHHYTFNQWPAPFCVGEYQFGLCIRVYWAVAVIFVGQIIWTKSKSLPNSTRSLLHKQQPLQKWTNRFPPWMNPSISITHFVSYKIDCSFCDRLSKLVHSLWALTTNSSRSCEVSINEYMVGQFDVFFVFRSPNRQMLEPFIH